MKKFISLLLATSMAFAVPVFADTEGQSYAEVYAEKAKELETADVIFDSRRGPPSRR